MGFWVHFSVCYNCSLEDSLITLVNKHKKLILKSNNINDYPSDEALDLLNALINENNYNIGSKGELFTWGIVGNYTNVEKIVLSLSDFFKEQLKNKAGCSNEAHIILFEEKEESNQAKCWEVYLEGNKLIINRHELPFCWNQY